LEKKKRTFLCADGAGNSVLLLMIYPFLRTIPYEKPLTMNPERLKAAFLIRFITFDLWN
jgi:hypothetical protein